MSREYFCTTRSVFIIKSVERKIIILYENHTCFAMCSIFHFMIFVFAYNAFHFKFVFIELISYILHNFFSLNDRIIINFVFRNDIFNIFIFRRLTRLMKNVHVNSFKTLFANLISY